MTLEDTLTSRDKINAALRDGARRGDGQVGHPRQPRRAEGDRPARRRSRRRWRSRCAPSATSARRSSPPRASSSRRSSPRRARSRAPILRAEGQRESADPPGRGPVEGDRDGLRRDPPRRRRPEAARLPVPPDAAADRPGRVEQALDHPERGDAGAREHRLDDPRRRTGRRPGRRAAAAAAGAAGAARAARPRRDRPVPSRARCPSAAPPRSSSGWDIRRWRARQSSPASTCAVPLRQRRPTRTRTRGCASMLRT